MKHPDGPQTPRWLQKIQWTLDPLGYMDAATQRYGDIFNASVVGNYPVLLLVSNPEALKQIFSGDTQAITAPSNRVLQPVMGDYSVFVLEGSRHRRERKLLMPPFHGDHMRAYGRLICDLTEKAMGQITPGQRFAARTLMQTISLEVILKVVFGLYEGDRAQQLKQGIVAFANTFKSPFVSGLLFFPSLQKDLGPRSPWGYFLRLQQQVNQLLYAEIRERRSAIADPSSRQFDQSTRSDILSLLLSARDEAGGAMTDRELRDELMTLLIAGHETTATAIAWALYWIHQLPEVQKNLLEELDTLGDAPEPMSIFRLPYLTAVCNEALRIYPVAVVTVPREVREPMELMGYALEPGTRLYGCIYLTHHREDIYPDPKQFKPERFLDRQFSPYEFFPFGGGVRRCIGEALALYEMKLVVATMLTHFRLALADSKPERPQRRGVTLAPADGVKMVMQGLR
ncbi:MAG: cytochrome P450 [Pseudanabaenales cyanobacterium]|nr:cytochrome P450 [Pseudanabaenales cyanobacterium]